MSQQVINSNAAQPFGLPNTASAVEQGDTWDQAVAKLNAMMTELYGALVDTMVAAGSALTLTAANNQQTIKLDTATGSTVTLPPATGSGVKFKFLVTVLATSNSHIVKVANASDAMIGVIVIEDTDTSNATNTFAAAATSDTITLNRSTTASVSKGEWIEAEDVAANVWAVRGVLTATGAPATPFSATV